MTTPRVKICGLTRIDQAETALDCGADAIGLVFYDESPRCVDVQRAAQIARACGPFVTITGLFVNADEQTVKSVLQAVPLNLLQFHGDEPPGFCQRFDRPYLKAIRMAPEVDPLEAMKPYHSASGILLDAYTAGVPGGTGKTFDWQRVPRNPPVPIVLAGGLTPDNVARAVAATDCYGVDVSGGVEASPGIKDPQKVEQFIQNARLGELSGE